MKLNTAQTLAVMDISTMPLEALQRHKVKLLDAWRESRAEYGMEQAVRDGFYVPMADVGASGFIPKDKWLTQNLSRQIDNALRRERELLES